MVQEKIMKCGIDREKGYLYFVDKDGDVSRAKMNRGRKPVFEFVEED